MSINRWAAKADPNQKGIVKGLKDLGYSVEVIRRPLDLLVGLPMGNILLEVKVPGKEKDLTPYQVEFFRTWRGPRFIVTTLDEAVKALESFVQ